MDLPDPPSYGGVLLTVPLIFAVGCSSRTPTPFPSKVGTELLRVDLEGDILTLKSKKEFRNAQLQISNGEIETRVYDVQVKWQGNHSLGYSKKNYNITFFTDASYTQKAKVDMGFGLGELSKWTLKANAVDGSQARNIVAARIARECNQQYGVFEDTMNYGVVDGYPVELYINGEYRGLYTMNIAKGKWLWGINDNLPGQTALEAVDWKPATAFYKEVKDFSEKEGWALEGGNYDTETIANFNAFVRFVRDATDEEFHTDLEEYLDLDAAINYLLMVHLLNGIDSTNKNVILITYDHGKHWAPALYDMDATWGAYWDGSIMSYQFLPESETDQDSTHKMMVSHLWRRLLENFGEEIADRWFSLRESTFSEEHLQEAFREFMDPIGEEAYTRDQERWPKLPHYRMKQIQKYLEFRLPYVDAYMESLSTR